MDDTYIIIVDASGDVVKLSNGQNMGERRVNTRVYYKMLV